MRFYLSLTYNTETVPFSYQHYLVGAFHKWLGLNGLHDTISLYSLGWLEGAKMNGKGFDFPNGAEWMISFWDDDIGRDMLRTMLDNPAVCFGMKVAEVRMRQSPEFSSIEKFSCASPILIKNKTDNGTKYYSFKDDDADYLLRNTLISKSEKAGIDLGEFSIRFDKSYPKAKTKLVKIKGVKHTANVCPVIIQGNNLVKKFAWHVGLGQLTGSCFGAIR